MKTNKYTVIIAIFFLLVSNVVLGQFGENDFQRTDRLMHEDEFLVKEELFLDLQPKSNSNNTENLNFNWGNDPISVAHSNALNLNLANEIIRNHWYDKQEKLIEEFLEGYLNENFSNFSEAKKALFEKIETRNIKHNKIFPENDFKRNKNQYSKLENENIKELKFLLIRKEEILSGNLKNSLFDFTKVDGILLRDIKDINTFNTKWDNTLSYLGYNDNQELQYQNAINKLNNLGVDYMQYILDEKNRFYGSFNGNKRGVQINLMQLSIALDIIQSRPNYTPYSLVRSLSSYNGSGWNLLSNLPYSNSERIKNYAYNNRGAGQSILFKSCYYISQTNPRFGSVRNEIPGCKIAKEKALNELLNNSTTEDLLADLAITGLGDRNLAFLNERSNLKTEVEKYFKVNNFSKYSHDGINWLLNQYQDNNVFPVNKNLYKSKSAPLFQDASNPNRAIKIDYIPQAVTEGITNFGNVVAELLKDNVKPEFEGSFIRSVFEANGLIIGDLMTNIWIRQRFSVNSNGGKSIQVNFENLTQSEIKLLNAILHDNTDLVFETLLEGAQINSNPCYPEPEPCPEVILAYLTVAVVNGVYDGLNNLAHLYIQGVANKELKGLYVRTNMNASGFVIPNDVDNITLGELFQVRTRGRQLVIELVSSEWYAGMLEFGISILDITAIISPTKGGGAFLLVKTGTGTVTRASVSAYFKTLAAIARTTLKGGRGYKSFPAFKRAEGVASPGNALHHIVEQNGFKSLNTLKFGKSNIHNTKNIINIPTGDKTLHDKVTRHYGRIHSFTNGKRFREWIADLPFEEQYKRGIEVLKEYGWDGVSGLIN